MADEDLLLEREDGYAVVTLNRPDVMNALSPQLICSMDATGVARKLPSTSTTRLRAKSSGITPRTDSSPIASDTVPITPPPSPGCTSSTPAVIEPSWPPVPRIG